MTGRLFIRSLAVCAVAAVALAGCRDEEQDRFVRYEPGVYKVRLSVQDDTVFDTAANTDVVTVTVRDPVNLRPTARVGESRFVSIGAIEPQFYAELLAKTGLADEDLPDQNDRSQWPAMKERLADLFRQRTRDEWCDLMDASDVCFAPVLSLAEAPQHPHNVHRGTFVEVEGVSQPAPAPRFSRTPAEVPGRPPLAGEHTAEALVEWGIDPDRVEKLHASGAVAESAV